MSSKAEGAAPLVADEAQQQPQTCCQSCCRHLIVFFTAAVVGLLIGLGFTKGLVAIIITLVVLLLILGVVVYFVGWQKCRQNCVSCFDINQDGRFSCHDCGAIFARSPPETLAMIVCGFVFGIAAGIFI